MQDNTLEHPNMPVSDGGRNREKSSWPTASARVSHEDLHLLDAAAYKLRIKRSELIHKAIMERARTVLGVAA